MEEEEKLGMVFSVVSFLSGSSLVGFGLISLLVVAFSFSWWGLFVSWALLVHGVIELVARHGVVRHRRRKMAQLMVRNQLVLALSVSLYSLGMIFSQGSGSAKESVNSELVQEALALYPPELSQSIEEIFPLLHWILYGTVIFVVCVGCASTAWYYNRKTGHLAA